MCAAGPAPWRDGFLADVTAMGDAPEFALATAQPDGQPRVRFCVFRGMWAGLPPPRRRDGGGAARNAAAFESDLPTFTTDVRSAKVAQLFAAAAAAPPVASAPAGPVEVVFWARAAAAQWRIRGTAFVVGADIDDDGAAGAAAVRTLVGSRMRATCTAVAAAAWSWRREVEGQFDNLSPILRASFANPPPGSPLAADGGAARRLGQGAAASLDDDPVARENFRVVVIVPDAVERLDLLDAATAQRWLYTFEGTDGERETDDDGAQRGAIVNEWRVQELWP